MLPSLSTMGNPPMPPTRMEPPMAKHEEPRDELVEVGTILALLKLLFG